MDRIPTEAPTKPAAQQDYGWEIGCHLSALASFLQIPLANVFAPLAIWLFKRAHSESMERVGRHVINFQISMTLYCGVLQIITRILFKKESTSSLHAMFNVPWRGLEIASIALIIIAAYHASKGDRFRYPLTIRFIPEK
ncbi:MAG: DUF4870 domain-containing protein [Pedosphaera sp.]|nr:DUF4870 domain-containing protein [Pedosphaera sp.]